MSQRSPVARRTAKALANGASTRRQERPRRVEVSRIGRARAAEPEAEAGLRRRTAPAATRRRCRTRSARRRSCPTHARRAAGPASRRSRSPWSTAEDRRVAPQQRLVLELEVLGERHERPPISGAGQRVVEVGDLLADGDRRQRRRDRPRRVAVEGLGDVRRPRAARRRSRRRRCRRRPRAPHRGDGPSRSARRHSAPGCRGRQPRREQPQVVLATSRLRHRRSMIGRAAHTTTSPASSPTLVPNSSVWAPSAACS